MAVEGPHDVAFVGRFLRLAGFSAVTDLDTLELEFQKLVPRSFPIEGDLRRRMPVPVFHQTDEHAVAIYSTEGESNLAKETANALNLLTQAVNAVGFILDADLVKTPAERFADMVTEVGAATANLGLTLALPMALGDIAAGPPRCGIYIMPDNQSAGTLEDVLLDCAGVNYPDLKTYSATYLDNIPPARIAMADFKEFRKPAGRKKAHVASIGSLLKPGKAIQVSLQDNEWVNIAAMALPKMDGFRQFLRTLLNEPAI